MSLFYQFWIAAKWVKKGWSICDTFRYIICYTMFARHYAVRNKAKLFRLFDQGKHPSDIELQLVGGLFVNTTVSGGGRGG